MWRPPPRRRPVAPRFWSLDGSLEACEREDSVGPLSLPSSRPSLRASLLGSRYGRATSLALIGGAFPSRSRSRNTSSGSGRGTGSGVSLKYNSHVSVSSASLTLGHTRAQSLIHSIGGASRSSVELVRVAQAAQPVLGAVRFGDLSDAEGARAR